MVTADQYMMVRDRIRKKIIAHFGCRLNPNLCSAEIGFVLTARELYIFRQKACHISAHFDERIVS